MTFKLHQNEHKTLFFFSTEYFTDLEGRKEQDPTLHWDFYSSSLFGKTLPVSLPINHYICHASL